jgi:hypothetical protein
MSDAILAANLPTLVPPYFWTSHFAEGSIVFWCRLGGVRAPPEEMDDEREDGRDCAGVEELDILTARSRHDLCQGRFLVV